MEFGIYRKIKGHTGVGMLYQFSHIVRHHTTGAEMVEYIPLRIEPEWAGTVRFCVLERDKFDDQFVFVSERLPKDPADYHDPNVREKHPDGRNVGHSPLYVRPECPFHYCDGPDICRPAGRCRHR